MENNNLEAFVHQSSGYISFERNTNATTKALYGAYRKWCADNLEKPMAEKTFASYLKADATSLGIQYDKNLGIGGGKKARGYHNVNVLININTKDFW